MKAVIQRVSQASVSVKGTVTGHISRGLLVLLGVGHDDNQEDLDILVRKIPTLRIFNDEQGKMNLSLADVGGSILAVSQFTLFGTWRRGNRPGFTDAAAPEKGERMYEQFISMIREKDIRVETGIFGAMMNVELVNEGPATFVIDTKS